MEQGSSQQLWIDIDDRETRRDQIGRWFFYGYALIKHTSLLVYFLHDGKKTCKYMDRVFSFLVHLSFSVLLLFFTWFHWHPLLLRRTQKRLLLFSNEICSSCFRFRVVSFFPVVCIFLLCCELDGSNNVMVNGWMRVPSLATSQHGLFTRYWLYDTITIIH